MSKQVHFLSYQPVTGGPVFGRVSDPAEFEKSQLYAHQHTENVTRDLLMQGAEHALCAGFGLGLTGGLNFLITPGQAIGVNGRSYNAEDVMTLSLAVAHPTLPRIDLVYAVLETDVEAKLEYRPFARLRTSQEIADGVPPYTPTEFNRPTELHDRATVQVRTGTPNATPTAPTANANEIPLFQLTVNAASIVINTFVDVRPLIKSLSQVVRELTQMSESIDDRVAALLLPGSGIAFIYDDPANGLTVSADAAWFDNRYANITGDTFTGPIIVAPSTPIPSGGSQSVLALRGGTANQMEVLKVESVDSYYNSPGIYCGGRITLQGIFQGSGGTAKWDIFNPVSGGKSLLRFTNGARFEYDSVVTGADGYGFVFKCIDLALIGSTLNPILSCLGANNEHRFYVNQFGDAWVGRNLSVFGSISKGSGTFHIDHPLDPENKDLLHGFVESPRFDLMYRGRAQMIDGSVVVSIDAASNMTAGTFDALTMNAEVVSLCNRTNTDQRLLASEITNGEFEITAEDSSLNSEIAWVVIAERADAYIATTEHVNADKQLIVEKDKPALTAADVARLTDKIEYAETISLQPDLERFEAQPDLIGKVGFPRLAAQTGVGLPRKKIITRSAILQGQDGEQE